MKKMLPRKEYLKMLPRKRTAVGVLLFNCKKELLILKMGYNEHWNIPGGCIEEGEFLLDGLHREIKEEIGINVKIKKCVVVEDKVEVIEEYLDESLQFVFLGERLTKNMIKMIKIDNEEIIDFKFVNIKEAIKLINPKMSRRIKIVKGRYKNCTFMEKGRRVL